MRPQPVFKRQSAKLNANEQKPLFEIICIESLGSVQDKLDVWTGANKVMLNSNVLGLLKNFGSTYGFPAFLICNIY